VLLLAGCEVEDVRVSVEDDRQTVQNELRSRYGTLPRRAIALDRFEAASERGLLSADAEAYCDAAGVYFSRGEYGKAIAAYGQALEIAPEGVRPLYNLGKVYRRIGRMDDAIRYFTRAVELAPEFADGYLSLGAAYGQRAPAVASGVSNVRRNDQDKSIENCRKAVALEPHNAFFHFNLARAYHVNNQSGEAAQAYVRSQELGPDRADTHKHLGSIYAQQAKSAEAVSQYELSIRLDSTDAETYFLLAKELDRQGALQKAVVNYKLSIALNPDVPDVHYGLGKAYHRMGKAESGQREMEAFESLKARGGDALFAARMWVQKKPDGAAERRSLAAAYMRAGPMRRSTHCWWRWVWIPDWPPISITTWGWSTPGRELARERSMSWSEPCPWPPTVPDSTCAWARSTPSGLGI
jgi:tetratricopeptide (TPR) repeat protein